MKFSNLLHISTNICGVVFTSIILFQSSQWHCAACNKSCNSMQTFDAHCASVKHRNKVKQFENQKFEEEFEQVENPDQFDKLEQPAEAGEVASSSSSWQAPPPPPPTQRPPKPLKVDKEVGF